MSQLEITNPDLIEISISCLLLSSGLGVAIRIMIEYYEIPSSHRELIESSLPKDQAIQCSEGSYMNNLSGTLFDFRLRIIPDRCVDPDSA